MRCAAANDDEDFGEVFDSKEDQQTHKMRSTGQHQVAANGAASIAQGTKRRKQKQFAWMDSDDEELEQKDDADSADDTDKLKEDNAEEETVSVEVLDQVNSFGRMMLFAPSVSGRLRGGDLSPSEVSAVCRALARTKFFDKELLDDLYEVLRTMISGSKLSVPQTSDALRCLKALNAYDQEVCSAISRCFTSKTRDLETGTRNEWLEAFKTFNHTCEPDFLQKLEVPPVLPQHPNYKKVRCWHFSRGTCVLNSACTFSHDQHAPLSLADGTKEDWWKCKSSIMMTQNQKTLGQGSYGTGPLGVNPM